MRATLMYGAGDVRLEQVPDPVLREPTDALVRVLATCVCGSDLHPYRGMPATDVGQPMGHEFVGVVVDTGSAVDRLRAGDVVIAPFAASDNSCEFCVEGLSSACRNVQFWGYQGLGGGQAEAVRVPLADSTLVKADVREDDALLPSLLTLSDVLCTGHHAAVAGGVSARTTVTVIGDGAVGLSAVLAARRLGAERIILMGRHADRTQLGREWGATDVVAERDEEGVVLVRELAGGDGTHAVLEAVGSRGAYDTAVGVVRSGGVISRVGMPQYDKASVGLRSLFGRNIRLAGGPAPVRSYIDELLPEVLDGRLQPGRVFDWSGGLDDVVAGYEAMDSRTALKALLRP